MQSRVVYLIQHLQKKQFWLCPKNTLYGVNVNIISLSTLTGIAVYKSVDKLV